MIRPQEERQGGERDRERERAQEREGVKRRVRTGQRKVWGVEKQTKPEREK